MRRGLFFRVWGSLTSLKSRTRDPQLKVLPGGLVLRIFTSWKNPRTLDLEARPPMPTSFGVNNENLSMGFLKLAYFHLLRPVGFMSTCPIQRLMIVQSLQGHFVTQIVTGHGVFREKLQRMKLIMDPTCNCPLDVTETLEHILYEWTKYNSIKNRFRE